MMPIYRFVGFRTVDEKKESKPVIIDNNTAAIVLAQTMSDRAGFDVEVWKGLALIGRFSPTPERLH